MPLEEMRAVRAVADEVGCARAPRRRAPVQRGRGRRGRRRRARRHRRHRHVLRVQGPRRADRFPAVRAGRDDGRSAPSLDPVRRRLAAGRHHGGGRHRRPRERATATARGPRTSAPPRGGCARSGCPARSISTQVATNMVLVDTEAVGLGVLETIERLETFGVGVTHHGHPCAHGHPRRHRRRGRRRGARRMGRARAGPGIDVGSATARRSDGTVHQELPAGDRPAHPAWPAPGEDMAGAALRADPELRRRELGPRGLGPRRAAVPAHVRGVARPCPR